VFSGNRLPSVLLVLLVLLALPLLRALVVGFADVVAVAVVEE